MCNNLYYLQNVNNNFGEFTGINKNNHIVWNKNWFVDGMQRYSYKSSWKCNPKEDIMLGVTPNYAKNGNGVGRIAYFRHTYVTFF